MAMEELKQMAIEARRRGITYGQLAAEWEHRELKEEAPAQRRIIKYSMGGERLAAYENREQAAARSGVREEGRRKLKCPVCGKEFEPQGEEKICSPECRLRWRKEANERWWRSGKAFASRKVKHCPGCGREFLAEGNRRWCSPACREKGKNNDKA